MEITVLVEHVAENRYRARSGEPLVLTAEGATEEVVLQKLEEQMESRMACDAHMVQLTVPGTYRHPSARFRGSWSKDDPVIQQWKKCVEEYRQQVEDDPNIL